MIQEAYCSFEVAKLLREKGFNEEINTHYLIHLDEFAEFFHKKDEFPDPEDVWLKCPTHQMAVAWLREVHHIIIVIQPLSFNVVKDFLCENWVYSVWLNANLKIDESLKNQNAYSTYEEAVEAALKHSLENLI